MIGVRLSAFDAPPFKPDPARSGGGKLGPGVPEEFEKLIPYQYGFGCDQSNPLEMDLTEPIAFINMLASLGVRLINASCGSPAAVSRLRGRGRWTRSSCDRPLARIST